MLRSSSTVALDIGPDAIVVVHSSGAERARLRRAVVHPLPAGLVADGEVVDAEELASELRSLFAEHKLPRDVRVGVAHPRLMVRMVELPGALEGRDLDSAVRHLAGDLLPVGLDQLVVDYRRVGRMADNGPASDTQRVLMAAARVDAMERLMRALESAGLRVQRIQLSGLAMLAALDHPPVAGEAILYVQTGALTNVVITEDGEPLLVRAASAGSESIAAGLAERAGITHEEARAHVAALGVGPAPRHGAPALIKDELESSVTQQVREGLRRIVAEVQSSRGFYSARPDARPIGAVVLTGPMTTWPGIADALRDELHLPVLPAGRDAWPDLGRASASPEILDVAVGLAMGGAGEHPDLRPTGNTRSSRTEVAVPARVAQVACAMAAVLAAVVVYLVAISNQVNTGREELGRLQTQLVSVERQAAALKPYDDFAQATVRRRDAVISVANTRFKWDRTLAELAQVAPRGVWLTSAKGTLTPTTQIDGGTADSNTGTLRGLLAAPALELSGCAAREKDVPGYMERLQAMTGVTEVGFSRSERLLKKGAAGGGGDCRNGDEGAAKFGLVTYFKPSPAAATAAPAASGQGASTAGGLKDAAGAPVPVKPAPAGATASAPSNQTAAAAIGGTR